MAVWNSVNISYVLSKNRIDSEFYKKEDVELEFFLNKLCNGEKLKHVTKEVTERFNKNQCEEFQYNDIGNTDLIYGNVKENIIKCSEAPGRATYINNLDDVLISSVRPNRNANAIINKNSYLQVGSNGFCNLRSTGLDPNYVFAFSKTKYFIATLVRATTSSMYPAVSNKDILNAPFFIPNEKPEVSTDKVVIKRGGKVIIFLGLLTIFSAVNFHNILHLPPMLGMMFGLGLLGLFSFYLKITYDPNTEDEKFDFFKKISKAEWDTLLFFFGVILSVGGLGFIGYLTLVSEFLYDGLGPTIANSIVGILSAIVDNIPVMFAVITMRPEMSIDQWLLVTLTTGVGGSLLSIGSAAGVALMGQARGYYTFFGHLKWTPVIFLGYVASIYVHVLLAGLTL